MHPRDFARVFLGSAAIPGLYARTNAHAAPRGTAGTGSAPAAPTFLADQAFFHARLALPIVVANVVGPVAAVPSDFPRVILLAAAIARLDLVALLELVARAGATVLGPNQALGDARFPLAVVVVNIVGVVPAVSTDFARVELSPTPIVRFYLVTLTESIASAVGIAVPAAERRDEACFDARLGFAVVVCV